MNKISHQFFLRLILFIPLIFAVHTAILSHKNLPLYGDKIVLSYLVNSLLAIAIFMILYVFRKNTGIS
jgi:Na+/H+-dicarboxylate symporter